MIFLISLKLWKIAMCTHMDLKCQFYENLNRFHAFWADYIFFFREMLANNHKMENELIDLFNFLPFQSKCPFRWKIQLVPSCCGITLKLPEIALQEELYESFLMCRSAVETWFSKEILQKIHFLTILRILKKHVLL